MKESKLGRFQGVNWRKIPITLGTFFCHLWHGAQGQDHHYANGGEALPRQPVILKWLASGFLNDRFGQYRTTRKSSAAMRITICLGFMWEA